jgi:hypothetical protein
MIGNWNYRRCKQRQVDDFDIETVKYFIAEVYYSPDNKIVAWDEQILKDNESEEDLKKDFDKIRDAFKMPILDLDNIEINSNSLILNKLDEEMIYNYYNEI